MSGRELDSGLKLDLAGKLTYGGYLRLDRLLSAQVLRSRPEHHDEMLFIIQHHVAELWMKLAIHELQWACARVAADALRPAFKALARVKLVQEQLIAEWSVLETLTPYEYQQFRPVLENASGFQSYQNRALEFLLNNKEPRLLASQRHDPKVYAWLEEILHAPSIYDEFLRYLARKGYAVPQERLERDFSEPYESHPGVTAVLREIYANADAAFDEYEMCEKLMDVEVNLRRWRFRHLRTVERIIGHKPGTGGSSGVGYLASVIDVRCFPELTDVRTELGA
ncbi:MAG TPA: tryptophan 2,3-dioxygenase family protein [Gammaproteobacteria bacterium]|nr:tryptophan 2,3-dioxygenase family protein [Gammaproteobacteria bacterium]